MKLIKTLIAVTVILFLPWFAGAAVFSVLHGFNLVANGGQAYLTATLVQAPDGTIYGVSAVGGTNKDGAIFELGTNGAFSVIYNFSAIAANSEGLYTNGDGYSPMAGLILAGQTLYGTTSQGGTNSYGTVFAVSTDGTGFTNLYNFTGGKDGANPGASLVLSGNRLYGTTEYGGTNGFGAVFAVNTDGTDFSPLYSFSVANLQSSSGSYTNREGAYPAGGLVLSGNALYGTASQGGTNGSGTIFALDTNGLGLSILHTFKSTSRSSYGLYTNSDGDSPLAGLIFSGGTLYGTASGGGTNGNGTVFAINTNGTGFAALHSFTPYSFNNALGISTNTDGASPQSGLFLSGNTLYGTTIYGGTGGQGTVFSVNTGGTVFADLYNFYSGNDGVNPVAGVIVSGNILYGTAPGAIFELNTNGTDYFNFAYDGYEPATAGLTLAGSTLYGTTKYGGAGAGTVYKMNDDGSGYAVVYSFDGTNGGANPVAGVIAYGNLLYGTTQYGGTNGDGIVFRVNTDGTGFTNLYNFTGGNDGANPVAGLVLSSNRLYGTTENGGTNALGTVFAIGTNGSSFTPLYSFTGGGDGANPVASLILSSNTLYGTTENDGTPGYFGAYGTVFAINTDGTGFNPLYTFLDENDGANPEAGLILSGNTLYGTTVYGGTNSFGAVFAINTDGSNFNPLYSFTGGSDGAYPYASLGLSGGTLYGVSSTGYGLSSIFGVPGYGTVFAIGTNGSSFAALYEFTDGMDGAYPAAGLVLSGNVLFGTASSGGAMTSSGVGSGTVFAVVLSTSASVPLTIQGIGNVVVLTWSYPTSTFNLQSAPSVTGPFSTISGATSPYTNVITGAQQFFRLQSN